MRAKSVINLCFLICASAILIRSDSAFSSDRLDDVPKIIGRIIDGQLVWQGLSNKNGVNIVGSWVSADVLL